MLRLPATPGVAGTLLLLAGLLPGLAAGWYAWRRAGLVPRAVAVLIALAVSSTVGPAPFIAWRIVQDVRFTRGLTDAEAEGAGPIQAFLEPTILDEARRIIPIGATYYALAGEAVRDEARSSFSALALTALFPRISVSTPEDADWLVAWGVDPRTLDVPLAELRIVRQPQGPYPEVYVARVAS